MYDDLPEFEKVTDAIGLNDENAVTEGISVIELNSVTCVLNEMTPVVVVDTVGVAGIVESAVITAFSVTVGLREENVL